MKEREKRKTRLKELIQQADLTQRELSDLTGVTEKAINDMVRGISYPRFDRAAAIARALKVSLIELADALGIETEGIPDLTKKQSVENTNNVLNTQTDDSD